MQTTLLRHPALTVRKSTGHEGPRHDPYSFEELEFVSERRSIVVHLGLAVFAIVDGEKITATGKDYEQADRWADSFIVELTGYTKVQIERFYRNKSVRCSSGGEHWTVNMPGYPGETFELCTKCNKVINSYFCESAVI